MSLIEVILGAAVVAITAVAIPEVMKLMQHNSAQSQAIRVSVTERTKIEAFLKNHAAWAQTMQKSPSFVCGVNGAGCSENTGNDGFYNFVLYGTEPNEKLTYDPNDPTTRLTLQGTHCPTGVPNPSERCPIQFQAMWKPICAAYPCVNPTLQIKVKLSTKYGSGANDVIPINVEKYSHSSVRSFNEDDIQSACFMLNGVYNSMTNTCFPPHAGRNCASLGKPAQVVTGVDLNGNITCSPFYHNTCDPVTQMMTGISATGAAICSLKPPPVPVVNCVGNWGACSAACNGGTQTYAITTPASGGGLACPFAAGATQACNVNPCAVNCVGSWQSCTQPCGGGTSTFIVTTPAANGGSACIANHGDTMGCNTQACGVPVDCAGTWSSCDPGTGTQVFTMTQAAQNGGAACPASPRTCQVDCVGDWGACSAGSRTYTWSVTPKNGGASCSYANGATDTTVCSVTFPSALPTYIAGGWQLAYTGFSLFQWMIPCSSSYIQGLSGLNYREYYDHCLTNPNYSETFAMATWAPSYWGPINFKKSGTLSSDTMACLNTIAAQEYGKPMWTFSSTPISWPAACSCQKLNGASVVLFNGFAASGWDGDGVMTSFWEYKCN